MKSLIVIIAVLLSGCSYLDFMVGYDREMAQKQKALGTPLSLSDATEYCGGDGVLKGKYLDDCIAESQENGRGEIIPNPDITSGPSIYCSTSSFGNTISTFCW